MHLAKKKSDNLFKPFHYTIVELLDKIAILNLHELKPLLELIANTQIVANHGNIVRAIQRFNFYPSDSEMRGKIQRTIQHINEQCDLVHEKSQKHYQERKNRGQVVT